MSEIAYYVEGDFACSIWEHSEAGHLCGYVAMPPAHPWYGKWYDDIRADVHGGLTYCGPETEHWKHSVPVKQADGTWLFPEPRRWLVSNPDGAAFPHDTGLDLWWVGFDCAHLGDRVTYSDGRHSDGVYRDETYVRGEISGLVEQAAAAYMEAL